MGQGLIFDIQRFSVHDGPGIRTTVFMKGCSLRCAWCHNPEGLSAAPQIRFLKESCIGCQRCRGERTEQAARGCPAGALSVCGSLMSVDEVLDLVLRDRDFYARTGGVTFSGGECLTQSDFVVDVLSRLTPLGIHTAIDTSGAVSWESIEKTLGVCDLYLYDVKCADTSLHLKYTGQGNERILDNLRRLSACGKPIWIRVPVIPDVNDSDEQMQAIARIVSKTPSVHKVTLMPYHTLGINKYEQLGLSVPYQTDKRIEQARLEQLKQLFRDLSLTTD